jgi:hypothetical protein
MEQIFLFSSNVIQDKSGTSNLPLFGLRLVSRFQLKVQWAESGVVNILKSVLIKLIKITWVEIID